MAITDTLLDADEIPVTGSGLDGAEPLTVQNLKQLIGLVRNTLVGTDGAGGLNTIVYRRLYAKAAGERNLIG